VKLTRFQYQKSLGTIEWPLRLLEDAQDNYNYTNTTICTALEYSYGAILEILYGYRTHPITSLFQSWLMQQQSGQRKGHSHPANFLQCFQFGTLLGDKSLISPLLLHLRYDLGAHVMDHHADVISMILFRVVIARTYLGRSPSDDEQIFYLGYTSQTTQTSNSDSASLRAAKLGKIFRKLTIHELVMSASLDSSYSSETILLTGSLHQGFTTQATDIQISEPIIEALTVEGFRYEFHESNLTGLAGARWSPLSATFQKKAN
jgi:hypothetical protein